jgi:hypothetical protein
MLLTAVRANHLGVVLLHLMEKLGESTATVAAENLGAVSTGIFVISIGHKAILSDRRRSRSIG